MKKTRLVSSLAALALVLGLGACEQAEEQGTSGDENTSSSVTESNDSTTSSDDTTPTYPAHDHVYDYETEVLPSSDGRHHGHLCTICGLADPDDDDYGAHIVHCDTDGDCTGCSASGLNTSYLVYDVGEDGCYYVKRYDEDKVATAKEVFIPQEHDGAKVTGVGVPDSKEIWDAAFHGYEENPGEDYGWKECLEFISVPDTVTAINNYAFYFEYMVTEIALPEGIKTIGNHSFDALTIIEEINIPSTVESIGDDAFYACNKLKSITIPEGVTRVGEYCFKQCYALEEVNLPSTIEEIGEDAFETCTSLASISLPESLTSIERHAFRECTALDNVVVPEGVTFGVSPYIGYYFYGCSSLTNIKLPSNLTSLDNYFFAKCTSLESFVVGSSVTAIKNSAFSGCTALKEITIPTSVTSIEANVFNGCDALTTINYEGTQDQWNAITISETGNDVLSSATINYNYSAS